MKIKLDRETIPDELYNMLLQQFVNQAVAQEIPVTGASRFEDWVLTCEVKQPIH